MPHARPAEIITSCGSLLYSRSLSVSAVVSNPERWPAPQFPGNPPALDSDGRRRGEQPRERPADAVIRDIRTFARMLEARHGRKYQFVHNRRIVKRKRAGKDPVADDPV